MVLMHSNASRYGLFDKWIICSKICGTECMNFNSGIHLQYVGKEFFAIFKTVTCEVRRNNGQIDVATFMCIAFCSRFEQVDS